MKLRLKIWTLPLTAAAIFLAGSAVSYAVGAQTSAALAELRDRAYPYKEGLDRFALHIEQFRLAITAAASEGDVSKIDEAKQAATASRDTLAALATLDSSAEDIRGIREVIERYEPAALQAAFAMTGKGEAGDSMQRMTTGKAELDKRTEDARKVAAERVQTLQGTAAKGVDQGLLVLITTGLITLAALGVASKIIVSSVWKDLGEEPATLRYLVERVAAGDLTVDIKSDGHSLRAALAGMCDRLRSTVVGIRVGADAISSAASEISAGNHDLSVRTEQTSSSLQQTASAMEEMTATVQHTAAGARQASELAFKARESASRGGEIVGGVVNNMGEISAASKRIGEIIGVIDGIAFQTNILALNAAVEAARAGEQGRGFAVVASEVRNLAQRSAQAAREIKDLVTQSAETVQAGVQRVHAAGDSMNEIVDSVRRVVAVIEEITTATSEQATGIGSVNSSVGLLDEMTQQNAALVEESAAAASSLNEQASRLVAAVSQFRIEARQTGTSKNPVFSMIPVQAV
jgi:methyl-accepting chemotaxis protein